MQKNGSLNLHDGNLNKSNNLQVTEDVPFWKREKKSYIKA
jgi:hypothetical protein